MNMTNHKRYFITVLLLTFCLFGLKAQNAAKAKQILDKTAAILNRKGGSTANFTISSANIGSVSGTISIKGNKFFASTTQAKTWFNGKTQWTYVVSSNEVNISNPSAEEQAKMNPYHFISLYKTGYKMSLKEEGSNYVIHLTSKKKAIQDIYITINKRTNIPSVVKIKERGKWIRLTVKNFKSAQLSDAKFNFNYKDFPKAEIIDLR